MALSSSSGADPKQSIIMLQKGVETLTSSCNGTIGFLTSSDTQLYRKLTRDLIFFSVCFLHKNRELADNSEKCIYQSQAFNCSITGFDTNA